MFFPFVDLLGSEGWSTLRACGLSDAGFTGVGRYFQSIIVCWPQYQLPAYVPPHLAVVIVRDGRLEIWNVVKVLFMWHYVVSKLFLL